MARPRTITVLPKINFVLNRHFDDDDEPRKIDVVYIHGLNGDPWRTWAHDATIGSYWPYWLQIAFKNVGVWSLGYDAPLAVLDYSQSLTLEELANELLRYLRKTEIGKCDRQVIFISHSLGGMMVKKMVVDAGTDAIVKNTRGIAFIAVPHLGLRFANLMGLLRFGLPFVYPNKVFEDLLENKESLTDLYSSFVEYAKKPHTPMYRYSFWEGVATKFSRQPINFFTAGLFNNKDGFAKEEKIGKKSTSQPYFKSLELKEESHSSISKPESPEKKLYQSVKCLVEECLKPSPQTAVAPSAVKDANTRTQDVTVAKAFDKLNAAVNSGDILHFFHTDPNRSNVDTSVITEWLKGDEFNVVKAFAWSFSVQEANSQLEEISTDLFFEKALTFFCDEELAKNSESGYSKAGKLAQLIAGQKALLILDGIDVLQDDEPGRTDGFKSLDIVELFRELQRRRSGVCICTTQRDMPPESKDGADKKKGRALRIKHAEFNKSSKLSKSALQFEPLHPAADSISALVKSIGIGPGQEVMRGVEAHQGTIKLIRELCVKEMAPNYDDAFSKYTEDLNGQPNQFRLYQIAAYGTALEALSCFFGKNWSGHWINEAQGSMAVQFESSACLKAAGRFSEAHTVLKGMVEKLDETLKTYLELLNLTVVSAGTDSTEPSLFKIATKLSQLKIERAALFLASSDLDYLQGSIEKALISAKSAEGITEKENSDSQDGLTFHIARLKLDILTAKATAEFASGAIDDAKSTFKKCRACARGRPSFLLQGVFEYCDFLLTDTDRQAWQTLLTTKVKTNADEIDPAAGLKRRVRRLISATVGRAGEDLWARDIGLFHLILGRLALYDFVRPPDERTSVASDESTLHLNAAVDCLRSAGILPSLPPALMARARLKHACGKTAEAEHDLDEAWQIAGHGPMPLLQADVLLHRVRLFGIAKQDASNEPYPWSSSSCENDLKQARRLIESSNYGRRSKELADAEAALRGQA